MKGQTEASLTVIQIRADAHGQCNYSRAQLCDRSTKLSKKKKKSDEGELYLGWRKKRERERESMWRHVGTKT